MQYCFSIVKCSRFILTLYSILCVQKELTAFQLSLQKPEIESILHHLEGTPWLVCALLYGGGMRLLECLHLRIKDVDFQRKQIILREGKKEKRTVLLSFPFHLFLTSNDKSQKLNILHQEDKAAGYGDGLPSGCTCF